MSTSPWKQKLLDTLMVSPQDYTGPFISQWWAMCGTAHTYQYEGTVENNQHKIIHVHVNTLNLLMCQDNCLCWLQAWVYSSHEPSLYSPTDKMSSVWYLLHFPKVQYDFNIAKSQAYDSQDHTPFPQVPEGCSHQKISMEITCWAEKGFLIHKTQNLSAVCPASELKIGSFP